MELKRHYRSLIFVAAVLAVATFFYTRPTIHWVEENFVLVDSQLALEQESDRQTGGSTTPLISAIETPAEDIVSLQDKLDAEIATENAFERRIAALAQEKVSQQKLSQSVYPGQISQVEIQIQKLSSLLEGLKANEGILEQETNQLSSRQIQSAQVQREQLDEQIRHTEENLRMIENQISGVSASLYYPTDRRTVLDNLVLSRDQQRQVLQALRNDRLQLSANALTESQRLSAIGTYQQGNIRAQQADLLGQIANLRGDAQGLRSNQEQIRLNIQSLDQQMTETRENLNRQQVIVQDLRSRLHVTGSATSSPPATDSPKY